MTIIIFYMTHDDLCVDAIKITQIRPTLYSVKFRYWAAVAVDLNTVLQNEFYIDANATKLHSCTSGLWSRSRRFGLETYERLVSTNFCQRLCLVSVSAIDVSCPRPIFRQILQVTIIKLIKSVVAVNKICSRAGLIMRPTRSHLSKANLSKLVFLNCNGKLLVQLWT